MIAVILHRILHIIVIAWFVLMSITSYLLLTQKGMNNIRVFVNYTSKLTGVTVDDPVTGSWNNLTIPNMHIKNNNKSIEIKNIHIEYNWKNFLYKRLHVQKLDISHVKITDLDFYHEKEKQLTSGTDIKNEFKRFAFSSIDILINYLNIKKLTIVNSDSSYTYSNILLSHFILRKSILIVSSANIDLHEIIKIRASDVYANLANLDNIYINYKGSIQYNGLKINVTKADISNTNNDTYDLDTKGILIYRNKKIPIDSKIEINVKKTMIKGIFKSSKKHDLCKCGL